MSMRYARALIGSFLAAATVVGCSPAQTSAHSREPIVGLPCEGCDAIFVGMPPIESMPSSARIAPESEPGQALIVRGVVRDSSGTPIPGVVLYAYQTNDDGLYPPDPALRGSPAASHGRLRAWARTNERGEYEFVTIRPGGYPGRTDPQHVHLHVLEPDRCTYYIDDVVFTDDPRLTQAERRARSDRGGSGITSPTNDAEGRWRVTRDITLGANIPGYPAR